MLGSFFKPKPKATDEEIKKDRVKWLDEMLQKSSQLERLIKMHSNGWKEFCELLNDYIDKVKKRKAITALDRATDADIFQLKLLDHEIYILNWVLKIPEQFIGQVEAELKKEQEKEE